MSEAAAPGVVALIDDDDDLRRATGQYLELHGYEVRAFADPVAALAAIDADFPGAVVTDVRMPGMSGIELFRTLNQRDAELPVIVMTGHGDIEMAVDALKQGAWDFLSKPFQPTALVAALARACRARDLTLENRRLRAMAEGDAGDTLIGDTPAMRQLRGMIPLLADASLDIVVEGQTGTGKEHYARLIHRAGKRARHRFVAIDCATLPPAIIERELFTHNGVVAGAHRGTLFLDNLAQASGDLQHRLVNFAETRLVGVNERDRRPVDVRIVASLLEEDRDAISPRLFHLLAGMAVRMPPLAERIEDIPLLFAHLVARAADRHKCALPRIADHAHRLKQRAWPGNVRELERAAERLCLGLETPASPNVASQPLPAQLDAFERSLIIEAVARAGGDMGAAIESLQIPRNTFYYRAKRLGIDLKSLR